MVAAAPAVEQLLGAVMFTDIVGFTEYTALEGDERALALLSVQEEIVAKTLPDGARLVKELGDGLLLWFPEVCAAVMAALELLGRFEDVSQQGDVPLWVRMGMHWGTASRRRDDIVGHDVNVAAAGRGCRRARVSLSSRRRRSTHSMARTWARASSRSARCS